VHASDKEILVGTGWGSGGACEKYGGENVIEVGVKKRTLWCEECGDLLEKIQAMQLTWDTHSKKTFNIQKLQHFAVDAILFEISTIYVHFDRHEPLADIGNSPGDRIACG
jgi:hypothetical protein